MNDLLKVWLRVWELYSYITLKCNVQWSRKDSSHKSLCNQLRIHNQGWLKKRLQVWIIMEEIKPLVKVYALYSIHDKECYTYRFCRYILAIPQSIQQLLCYLDYSRAPKKWKASKLVYETSIILLTKPNKDGTKTNVEAYLYNIEKF